MYKIKPPFNVNKTAQVAAEVALKDKDFINRSIKHNLIWAKKIKFFLIVYLFQQMKFLLIFFFLNFDKCKYSANYVLKKTYIKRNYFKIYQRRL